MEVGSQGPCSAPDSEESKRPKASRHGSTAAAAAWPPSSSGMTRCWPEWKAREVRAGRAGPPATSNTVSTTDTPQSTESARSAGSAAHRASGSSMWGSGSGMPEGCGGGAKAKRRCSTPAARGASQLRTVEQGIGGVRADGH